MSKIKSKLSVEHISRNSKSLSFSECALKTKANNYYIISQVYLFLNSCFKFTYSVDSHTGNFKENMRIMRIQDVNDCP